MIRIVLRNEGSSSVCVRGVATQSTLMFSHEISEEISVEKSPEAPSGHSPAKEQRAEKNAKSITLHSDIHHPRFSCSVRGFIAQIFRLPRESVFYDALRLSDVEQSRANKSPAKPSDHHTSQGMQKPIDNLITTRVCRVLLVQQ